MRDDTGAGWKLIPAAGSYELPGTRVQTAFMTAGTVRYLPFIGATRKIPIAVKPFNKKSFGGRTIANERIVCTILPSNVIMILKIGRKK